MRATEPCLCGDPACPWCGSGYRQPEDIAEDLAVALGWAEPSRWEIGRLCLELQDAAGDDALWQAVPEGSERLARTCMRVVSRWPDGPGDGLEFGHYRRCQYLDDAAAARALALARGGGWTPAQLGRYLAGYSPDEPGVAGMAVALAGEGGRLLLCHHGGGEWSVDDGVGAGSIGAAIRAAWRARYGAAVQPAEPATHGPGAYYTPGHIVDPAGGSGSFLADAAAMLTPENPPYGVTNETS